MHDPLGKAEIGYRTVEFDGAIAGDLELEDFEQVQADSLHHELADLPLAHDQAGPAVGAGEHAPDRIAVPGQVEFAVDLTYARCGRIDFGKQCGDTDLSCAHPGPRLDRVAPAVERYDRLEMTSGDAEVERVEGQLRVAHRNVHDQVFERQFARAAQRLSAQVHVGIGAAPARGIERQVRQHARAGFTDLLWRRGGRGLARRARLRDCPYRRPKVARIEQLRGKVAVHERAHASHVDREAAGHVALADATGKPVEAPRLAAAQHAAFQDIGVGLRQHNPDQRIQLRQAHARKHHAHVHRHQLEQAGHRAVGFDAGLADLGLDLEPVGLGFVVQRQHRAAAAARRQAIALIGAGGLERHILALCNGARAIAGRHVGADGGLLPRIVIADQATVERQAPDRYARALVDLLAVEQPSLAAVCRPFKIYHRSGQAHLGKRQLFSHQRVKIDAELDLIDREHLFFLRPGRIGEAHCERPQAWRGPGRTNGQVASNAQFTAGLVGDRALQGAARPIHTEDRDQREHNHRQRQ